MHRLETGGGEAHLRCEGSDVHRIVAQAPVTHKEGTRMQIVYNSHWYHVIEYAGGGLELISKAAHRGVWLAGPAAEHVRARLAAAAAEDASPEHLDDALGDFDALMLQPTHVH